MASTSKAPVEEKARPRPESPDNGISRASHQTSRASISSESSSESERAPNPLEIHTDELDLDNPFEKDNDAELASKVRTFVDTDSGLDKHFELLNCGAQLAKDKKNALANEILFQDLSEEQKEYLKDDEDSGRIGIWPLDALRRMVNGGHLSTDPKNAEEKAGFWGQSKYLKGSILSACLAGIIQGWTQSAMNGANLGITEEFHLDYTTRDNGQKDTGDLWVFGVLNAVPFLAGGLLAPLVSDPLQEYFLGRRGAIAVACVLSIAATIGQCFSTSIVQIIGCRIVTGLTLAAKASSAPLLTAEVAPNHLRGNLLSTWQLSDALGIFLGFSSNLATLHMHSSNKIIWRVQIATILIPTIILLFIVYFMPESPRYLMKRGRPVRALDSFTMLRPSPVARLLAARDLVYAHFQLQMECESINKRRASRIAQKLESKKSKTPAAGNEEEAGTEKEKEDPKVSENEVKASSKNEENRRDIEMQGHQGSAGPPRPLYVKSDPGTHVSLDFFRRIKQTFNDARSRRALVCASTAMISQQLTGINTITFLSATLLSTIHAPERTGAWVGFAIGLCNFVFGAPAFWLLDYVGRARMLLLGFIPMFVLMLILAFSFKEGVEGAALPPLVGVFGFFYMVAYSPTAGTSPFAISAEVFPLVVREVGHSLAVAVNFLGLGFVLLFFPSLSGAMGGYRGSLSLFAGFNLVAFVLCFLFVPETKGRSLEELRSIFDIPTRQHIKYRTKYVVPWLWRRFVHILAARLPSWLKRNSKSKGDAQRTPAIGFLEFRGWYEGEVLRRAIKARDAKIQAAQAEAAQAQEVRQKEV